MAVLDFVVDIVFGAVGTIIAYVIVIRLVLQFLPADEKEIEIVKGRYLAEILAGFQEAETKLPDPFKAGDEKLAIIDLSPLRESLEALSTNIGEYEFWARYLSRAKEYFIIGLLSIFFATIFFGLSDSDCIPSNLTLDVGILDYSAAIAFLDILNALAILCSIPFIYAFLWTFYHRRRLEPISRNARTVD